MSLRIPALDVLIHELTRLPGIGEKTAQRLAFHILKKGPEYSHSLARSLNEVSERVHPCQECYCYSETEICRICDDSQRSRRLICVVEQASDVLRIESAGIFNGLYHVLQGTLSPLDGVGPNDIRIRELLERVEKRKDTPHPIEEVIMALDADLEGDTTALYLSKALRDCGTKLTRIAHGVPFGSHIDYIDSRTLGRALQNRVEL